MRQTTTTECKIGQPIKQLQWAYNSIGAVEVDDKHNIILHAAQQLQTTRKHEHFLRVNSGA
jgi:hypothetical protein